MKIQSITANKFNVLNRRQLSNSNTLSNNNTTDNKVSVKDFAYRDFSINFGERLNRTPENFYAQPFNRDNMPITVKNYLFEDFDERHHMPPSQLQREAYQYLTLADTVDDIKEIYEKEPLFDALRSIDELKPNKGIFLLLKWDKETSNTPIFKDTNNKDLTVYLLKKVYLEGKTIDEINKDFDKDATNEIKRELGVKDGNFFTSSNLRTLGIKYPNLSYYNSFLATRNDKEYIPPVRKISNQPVSEETRQKLREASKSWWAGLNEIDRTEQIQKMLEGRNYSDSIIDKFKGPIMTLAAGKMDFSGKLSQIFAEKLSDEDFKEELPEFEERQREIMLEFWNKDPQFRKNYTMTLKSIITDFDFAYSIKDQSPEYLEDLLKQALEQKNTVLRNARERYEKRNRLHLTKIEPQIETQKEEVPPADIAPIPVFPKKQTPTEKTSLTPKEVQSLFKNKIKSDLEMHSKAFQTKMLEFLLKETPYGTKIKIASLTQPYAAKLSKTSEDEPEKIQKNIDQKMSELYKKFETRNPILSNANRISTASTIFKLTKELALFNYDNYSLQNKITPEIRNEYLRNKNNIDTTVGKLSKLYPRNDAENFYNNIFYPNLIHKLNSGFTYYEFAPDDNQIRSEFLKKIRNSFIGKEKCISDLQKHNAEIRFILDNNNDNEQAKDIILEKLLKEFLEQKIETASGAETTETPKFPKYKNPKLLMATLDIIRKNKRINGEYNTTSLKIAYGKLIHDKYLQSFDIDFKKQFIDFILSHPSLDKKTLTSCLMVGTNSVDPITGFRYTNKEKNLLKNYSAQTLKLILEDFKEEFPELANENEEKIKQAFSEVLNTQILF